MPEIANQISLEEKGRIDELRKIVKDDLTPYYDTDFNLLRWLQGHSSLPLAEIGKKLRVHLKTRKSYWDLDNIRKKPRNHPIHKHWKYGITGESGILENVIVNIEQCGTTDYAGMMESFNIQQVMEARIQDLEDMLGMCMDLEKKTGKQAYILYVMDVTGLEYNRKLYDLVTGAMRSLAEFMADHYVEMIKYFVPVNLPTFATVLYTAVRPLLPKRTEQKVRVLSAANWKEELFQFAQFEALPDIWNDEKHEFPVPLERPIPYPRDKYYVELGKSPPANLKSTDVYAGKVEFLVYRLKKGDRLSYWAIGNRNMGFGFFKARSEDDIDPEMMDQVCPTFTWMPGPLIVPLEDTVTIREDGTYKIWFSNSRAWWNTLTVQHAIEIIEV